MNEINKLNSTSWKEISAFDTATLSWQIIWSIFKAREGKTPEESRFIARNEANNFYKVIFKELWINVEINFSSDANDNFPLQVEALNEYILNWEITEEQSKNISKLFLWNHTKWSTEAIWAYSIVPPDTRIQLKDLLTYIPWILSLDPIVFYRNKLDKENTRIRNNEIRNTILDKKRVLIFPEWTRVEGESIGEFKTSLYKEAFKSIKTLSDETSQIITIITTDNNDVFPDTLEKSVLWLWNARTGTIKFTIDFIDASIYKNIEEFNVNVTDIIEWNLNKKEQ
jgi:hypothetical protein